MLNIKKITVLAFSLMIAVSCGGPDDVWEQYDYTDHAPYYPQTEDNDDTYEIPYQFGVCNDGTNMFGCE